MKRLINKLIRKIAIEFGVQIQKYNSEIAKASLPKFRNNPKNVFIELPRRIIHPERICIGNNVSLGPGSFIIAMSHYPTNGMKPPYLELPAQKFDSKIIIGNNVTSTADLQIAAQSEIIIEDDVMFASNIHINDGMHGFENANVPYRYQPIFKISPILIKKGAWIGQNVVIMPGVTIGKLSSTSSNSVVTESIPDQCIAFSNPAKIIKSWDEKMHRWI